MNVMPTRTTASSGSSGQAGFSLVELMIVIAIVAIMAGIAAPSFQDMVASQRLRTAGSALNESLWLARSEAIKRNVSVSFEFDDIANGWEVKTAGNQTLLVQEPISGITSGNAAFTFNPYGRLTAGAQNDIELQAVEKSLYHCLSITSTGRVTVEHKQCS